ncbi:YwnF family protein [Mesobacillus foraminis]|uniref:YwnF family protein n=1 Tax=Mesobacillus foraminis TaxID=279826 RepID=UPI001BE8D9BC|nr:YwnF family protein [Mesobacillus foraminis]MBT2755523.1 YwnF family protein [Mesobacillus foraminis]
MNLFMDQMPSNIKREIEQLQKILSPLMKKISKYAFWTMPLMGISIMNLGYLLFFGQVTRESIPAVIIFAVIGALGFALFKEVKLQQKELQKLSSIYIIERINKSEIATDYHKKEYISLIREQPESKAMSHFINFLMEEDQRKQMLQ